MALIPVSFETHARTKIRPLPSYAFAAATSMAPLSASEIVPFCHELPVVFTPEGDGFILAALTGLTPNRNLLVDETGRWHCSQIPGVWRRGPFRLAKVEGAEEERLVLCLDDSSDQVSDTDGQPLFDEAGQQTALLQSAADLLGKLETEFRSARAVCKVLNERGLIVPWPLEIGQPDGGKRQIQGLYHVDEAKLATLTGEDLVALRDLGALVVIYAHLLSLSKIGLLARIAQQLAQRDQQREAVRSNKVDLDRAFGIVEDDPFIF